MEIYGLMRQTEQPEETGENWKYLDAVRDECSVIDRTIRLFGHFSVLEYAKTLFKAAPVSFQPKSDFYQVVFKETKRLLGEETAKKAIKGIQSNPVVMTANHHGVDYFAQSVQGSMLFAKAHQHLSPSGSAALILSCGNIPLDNITYPQGLLIYGLTSDALESIPQKIPVFSNKYRRWSVCTTPSLNGQMVKNSLKRITELQKKKILSSKTGEFLLDFLSTEYASSEIKELSSYSDQSVRVNHKIWKNLFQQNCDAPELVQLELESVVCELLEKDLSNSQSLAVKVMFEKKLREKIFKELDGHRACWKKSDRNASESHVDGSASELLHGTHFFWGLSHDGRRFSLTVNQDEFGEEVLSGCDNKGNLIQFPFRPDTIGFLVKNRKLIPSLFTSFLIVAFARGFNCIGGYYQAEYLPQMKKGIINALNDTPGFRNAAKIVSATPTSGYLSGMQTVMTRPEEGALVPAGPAEIIAGGVIDRNDQIKMDNLTVKEAHIASMMETFPDVVPKKSLKANWKSRMASEYYDLLINKVVIK
jgi:hypothetical protein